MADHAVTPTTPDDSEPTTELEKRVKHCCHLVLDDPTHSPYVKAAQLKRFPPLTALLEHDSRDERVHLQRIRFVLRHADYAEHWNNHTYRIDADKLDAQN